MVALGVNNNDRFNLNANDNIDNNRPALGIGLLYSGTLYMKTYNQLFQRLISPENLEIAYWNARKNKTANPVVMEFEKHWRLHLAVLHKELRNRTYAPFALKKFILRDPKTRTICVSNFRDRVVHHALINIIQPIFEPRFIHDSYASRKGRGTLSALKRFDLFLRKASGNGKLVLGAQNANVVRCFALKADIKHYFQTVDHDILLSIIKKYVKDEGIIWLVRTILSNNPTDSEYKGMPLGNWTSQFFANIYLNELDQFVKHKLKARYYIRYVDDFVILDKTKAVLQDYKEQINVFLKTLKLELHPDKCDIIPLCKGVGFLGFKVFYHYKLVRQRNLRKIINKTSVLIGEYKQGSTDATKVLDVLQSWNAYAMHGNTFHLRARLRQSAEAKLMKNQ